MKHNVCTVILVVLMLIGMPAVMSAQTNLSYNKPATEWKDALPLGNGRLGAMVYGGVKSDTIQLNESTFWSGSPYFQGESGSHGQSYESVGNMILSFPGHNVVSKYHRELSVDDAIASVSYASGGVNYDREVLTSFSDDVLLVRIRASKKGTLSFSIDINSPGNKDRVKCDVIRPDGAQDELRVFTGHVNPDYDGVANGTHCISFIKVLTSDGRCTASNTRLNIADASEALIVVSSATNYVSGIDITGDAEQKARLIMKKFFAKGLGLQKFNNVLNEHKNSYHRQYSRVKLNIGDVDINNFFHFGRYLLICSSQKGGTAANLQGIWNPDAGILPYDGSNYDLSSSLPMTYWAAECAGMQESNQAYQQLIKQLCDKGARAAARQGKRGWTATRRSDVWGGLCCADQVAYNAWLCSDVWESYLYSGDRQYLSSVAFPIMAEACRYYLDNGTKSYQSFPQNNQMLYDLFYNTRQAAEIIASSMWGKAASDLMALGDSLDKARYDLLPIVVDKKGAVQASADSDPLELSHLWFAYPGCQLSPYRHPELASALKRSLLATGEEGNSLQLAWKACLWARLFDADRAFHLLLDVFPDAVCDKPAFNIAGNMACVAAMTEMLVQSHDDAVHLLPAVPSEWGNGEVSGLRCRGGYEIVNMKWRNGDVVSVTIRSTVGGTLRLRSHVPLHMANGRSLNAATDGPNNNLLLKAYDILKPTVADPSLIMQPELRDTYLYDIPTNPGTEYTFVR